MEPASDRKTRLVLGTAQLGMDYGIANTAGLPDLKRAQEIVAFAIDCGIDEFDTAQAYGKSEAVLGDCLSAIGGGGRAKILTKISPAVDHRDERAVERSIQESLDRLRCVKLHGLMIHREEFLALWEKGLGSLMKRQVEVGKTALIGVSVYNPEAGLHALRAEGIDFVQIPSNLFDRRFERIGLVEEAGRRGKGLYVRSVFLQGLLLMAPEALPSFLAPAKPWLTRLRYLSRAAGIPVPQLALGYVQSVFAGHAVLIGCESKKQLLENIRLWKATLPSGLVEEIRREFAHVSELVVNPLLWKTPQGRPAS